MVVVLPLTRTVANTITRVVVRIIRLGSPSLYSAANANAIAPLRPVQFLFQDVHVKIKRDLGEIKVKLY